MESGKEKNTLTIQKPGVWKKLLWLTGIFIALLFIDYEYHETMAKAILRNYTWLGFYRYGMVFDFRYSVDVLIGVWLYVLIMGYGLLRRRLSDAVIVIFPGLMIVTHYMTIL